MNAFSGRGFGGGGGGSAAQPVNTADTLRSKDRVEAILGMGEGPWKGPANGQKSFYLGTTQWQNADGSYNFDLFNIEFYAGNNPGETITPVLGGHQAWRGTNLPLTAETVQAFNTQSSEVSQVIIRLYFTALYQTGTDAQLAAIPGTTNTTSTYLPMTCKLEVRVKGASDADFHNPFNDFISITGKTQTVEYHEIPVIVTGGGPYYFEIINHTPDLPSGRCTVTMEGYYEVTDGVFGLTRSNNVGTEMVAGTPIVRTSQQPGQRKDGTYGIDYLNLRILVNTLYHQDDHGATFEDSITFKLEYKPSSSSNGWIIPFRGDCSIYGKTTSQPYVSEFRWSVLALDDTYDIRVTMLTPVLTGHFYAITWESFQEIVGGPAQFDNTAIMHVIGQASDQFSSVPDMGGEFDMKLCKIPSNYNPYTRVYTGTWDGTFVEDWTSNPAWCLYDLAMNATYGARANLPFYSMDRYDVYDAGVWCDQLVPNGSGGYQPRYTFNGLISEPRGIKDQLRYMAGVFNGTTVDQLNGHVTLLFDHDRAASAIFTPENVGVDGFSYSYTDPSTHFNSIVGKYNEPTLLYQTVPITVEDFDNIATYGRIPLQVDLIGCTNKHEAVRRIAYKMISALTEKEIVSFRTTRMGLALEPYEYFLVGDPDKGNSITGRIKAISEDRTIVYLRDLVYLEQGLTYVFRCNIPNPDGSDTISVVEIPFDALINGATFAFALSVPLPASVYDRAEFSLGCTGDLTGVPKAYRLTAVEEIEGDPDNVTVTGMEVNRYKWTLSDNATLRVGLDYVNFPVDIAPPSGFVVTTELISVNSDTIANVVGIWQPSPDPRVNSYKLQWRKAGETVWVDIASTNRLRADIYDVSNGVYDFRLAAFVGTTRQSAWVYSYSQSAGIDVPPGDVTNLALSVVGSHMSLNWSPIASKNLSYYWVRFSPIVDGTATWAGATDLVSKVLATSVQVAAGTGTFFVKAVNIFGVESINAASTVGIASNVGLTTVETLEQDPTWAGTKTNFTLSDGVLVATDPTTNLSIYEFITSDYGAVFSTNLSLGMVVTASKIGDEMVNWTNLASVTSLSGVSLSDFYTGVYIRVFDGTTWGENVPFTSGFWTGQQFVLGVQVHTLRSDILAVLFRAVLVVQMQARIEHGSNFYVEAGGDTITFDNPFKIAPTITVTNKASVQGDYYVISAVNTSGFHIQWFNASGTAVVREMDWIAAGYGGR